MDTKEKIIQKADELFRLYGMRSVTMDDISKGLGISKKTIYQYYSDKDEIVTRATRHMLEHEQQEIEEISQGSKNALDELFEISRCIRKNVTNINPSILFELQKYHAKAWEIYLDFKEHAFKKTITQNLERGIKEGFFRKEIDIEVLALMRLEQFQMIFDQRIFPSTQFDFAKVQTQILEHFIYGILTEKGRALYEEKVANASEQEASRTEASSDA
ncbi:MAG: TetR/AcrR family transcriptional regulator [Cyclobacteriaceae bacterium]